MSAAPIPTETESALMRGVDLRGPCRVCEDRFTEEVSRRRLREVRVERLAVGGS